MIRTFLLSPLISGLMLVIYYQTSELNSLVSLVPDLAVAIIFIVFFMRMNDKHQLIFDTQADRFQSLYASMVSTHAETLKEMDIKHDHELKFMIEKFEDASKIRRTENEDILNRLISEHEKTINLMLNLISDYDIPVGEFETGTTFEKKIIEEDTPAIRAMQRRVTQDKRKRDTTKQDILAHLDRSKY